MGGGLTNERPRNDYVITGPMRGLTKIAWEGEKQVNNDNTRTSRLLDQLGPEGTVGENMLAPDMEKDQSFTGAMFVPR